MLNSQCAVLDEQILKVFEGLELQGAVNVDDAQLLANVRSAIRRPYPQIRPQPPNYDRVVLVGSGPSLADTEGELVALIREGAKLVTVNGAYHWCLAHNLIPRTQIVMDARASNARFLEPAIPQCRYVLASQCAPETWNVVEGRPDVWMFHAAISAEGPLKELLDAHYLGQWFGVGGGTTVISRAISLLRMVGYLRFDLFGVDSCWMQGQHHAFDQPENAGEKHYQVTVAPTGSPELARAFRASGWHIKQAEDMIQVLRVNGDHFLLNIHGDGMLAYMLKTAAECCTVEAVL